MEDLISIIKNEFKKFSGSTAIDIQALPPSGSHRIYFRIKFNNGSIIAVFNTDSKENRAFLYMTKHFQQHGLPVPEIIYENLQENIYFLTDLGDSTLLSLIKKQSDGRLTADCLNLYKQAISWLPYFQFKAVQNFEFSVCYPRQAFDKLSILWDLNYFKYYFAKLTYVPFDEQCLEEDFERLANYLLETQKDYFLYRDFQSRNIMFYKDKPYFIDYQGGRRGALQYDIASILFEAKTFIHPNDREQLLHFYLKELNKFIPIHYESFLNYYYAYVYIRLMQAMGAYGYRGLYEKKELFLQSIPFALDHLQWLRNNVQLSVQLPQLEKVWDYLIANDRIRSLARTFSSLKITITSFSYRKGIPSDNSEHGGGFVFDCRAIPNPGRYENYKTLNGFDNSVIDYLENFTETHLFFNHVYMLVKQTIDNYLQRGFTYLSISFGCTGGQHRSVYFANRLAKVLEKQFNNISIKLIHRELNNYSI